jgi:uncharacterized protein (TIGR00255 family)
MTGYGRSSREQAGLTVTVEIRTVNHRHGDIRIRLPASLAAAESDLRRHVARRLRRGRIEVTIGGEYAANGPSAVGLNRPVVEGLVQAAKALGADYGLEGHLDVASILRFPDTVRARAADAIEAETALPLVEVALDEALDRVEAMRRDEGNVIAVDLAARLETIGRLRSEIASLAADFPAHARRRLERRIAELLPPGTAVAGDRLEQEIAYLADRADVTEELVRLAGYLDQMRVLLTEGADDAGRRFEFLLQEMNREANTIGSKAADHAVGARVVDIKLEIEKIREQVQNVE